MKEIYIFPFDSFDNKKVSKQVNFETKTGVFRGIACEKHKIDNSVDIFINNERIIGDIFYWSPILQKNDVFQKGMFLVKNGLGFGNLNKKKEFFVIKSK